MKTARRGDTETRRRGDAETTSRRGFTLIELLVVISIIALLVSILMPSLSRVRRLGRKAMCGSMLRGYAMATDMYAACNNYVMMDSYKFLDPNVGIPKYWGSQIMPEKVARCPDDGSTAAAGRMGNFTRYGGIRVSFGCNENMLSCSARATSQGPMAFWVNRDKIAGRPFRLMTWADWQNNPLVDPTQTAVVKPQTGSMGSLCFRHVGATSNAAFLDGHVGEMQALIDVANDGHDLAGGANWAVTGSVPQLYKCYYPFGVGATQTAGESQCRGDYPGIVIR